MGAAIGSNTITDLTEAYITNSDVTASTGNVAVEAASSPDNSDEVFGGAISKVAVSGSITVNVITLTTSAYITSTANNVIQANGTVAVAALQDLAFRAIAGAASGSSSVGVGAGNTTLVTADTTTAYIGPDLTVTGLGNGPAYVAYTGSKNANGDLETENVHGVSVTSIAFQDVVNAAAGGALAGKVGIAGSVPVETLNESSIAYIGANTLVNTLGTPNINQGLSVQAFNTTQTVTAAGSLGGAGNVGVGAGVDVGTVNKTTKVYIDDFSVNSTATINAAGDIRIQSKSLETITSVAATAGIGGTAGVGGSVAIYTLNVTTEAYIGNSVTITAGGNIQVAADEQNTTVIAAGAVSASATASIGAAIAVPVIDKHTRAWIGQSAHVTARGQGAAFEAATGYYGVNYADSTVSPSEVSTYNNTIDLGFAAYTGQPLVYTAAVGGAAIGGLTDGSTYYAIVPNNANPNQIQLATSQANADSGVAIGFTSTGSSGQTLLPLGVSFPSVNQSAVQDAPGTNSLAFLSPDTISMNGVAVTATSSDQVTQVSVAGSTSGSVSVPVSTVVHVVTGTTSSTIKELAQVDSDQSVLVTSGSAYYRLGVAGAAGVSAAVSVGAGVDVAVVTLTTIPPKRSRQYPSDWVALAQSPWMGPSQS